MDAAGIVKAVPCGLTYIYIYIRLKISLCYANERVYDRNQVNLINISLIQRLMIPWIVKLIIYFTWAQLDSCYVLKSFHAYTIVNNT